VEKNLKEVHPVADGARGATLCLQKFDKAQHVLPVDVLKLSLLAALLKQL
jgi:hypothetical protein